MRLVVERAHNPLLAFLHVLSDCEISVREIDPKRLLHDMRCEQNMKLKPCDVTSVAEATCIGSHRTAMYYVYSSDGRVLCVQYKVYFTLVCCSVQYIILQFYITSILFAHMYE